MYVNNDLFMVQTCIFDTSVKAESHNRGLYGLCSIDRYTIENASVHASLTSLTWNQNQIQSTHS